MPTPSTGWRIEREDGLEIPLDGPPDLENILTGSLNIPTATWTSPNKLGEVWHPSGVGLLSHREKVKVFHEDRQMFEGEVWETDRDYLTIFGYELDDDVELIAQALPFILSKRATVRDRIRGDSDVDALKHILEERVIQRELFTDDRNIVDLNAVEIVDEQLQLREKDDGTFPSSGFMTTDIRNLLGEGNEPSTVRVESDRDVGATEETMDDDLTTEDQVDDGATTGSQTPEEGRGHAADRHETFSDLFDDNSKAALLDGCKIENGELVVADQHPIDDDFEDGTLQGWDEHHVDAENVGTHTDFNSLEDCASDPNRDYAWYLDAAEDRIITVDVSTLSNPTRVTRSTGDFTFDDHLGYSPSVQTLVSREGGGRFDLSLIDASNAEDLTQDAVNTDRDWANFRMQGDYLYTCPQSGNFYVFDISATTFNQVGGLSDHNYQSVAGVVGDHAYAIANDTDLVVIDVSDPTNPSTVTTYTMNQVDWSTGARRLAAGATQDAVIVPDDGAEIVEVIDVSDPANPTTSKVFSTGTETPYNRSEMHDGLYVAAADSGIFVLEASDPTDPYWWVNGHDSRIDYVSVTADNLLTTNGSAEDFYTYKVGTTGVTTGEAVLDRKGIRKRPDSPLLNATVKTTLTSNDRAFVVGRTAQDDVLFAAEFESGGDVYLWEPPSQGSTDDLSNWNRSLQGSLGGAYPRQVKVHCDVTDSANPIVEVYDGQSLLGSISTTGLIRDGTEIVQLGGSHDLSRATLNAVDQAVDDVKLFGAEDEPTLDTDWIFESIAFSTTYEARKAALDVTQTLPSGTSITWKASLDDGATFKEVTEAEGSFGDDTWFEDADRGQSVVIRIEATGDGVSASPSVQDYTSRIANGWETGDTIVQSTQRNTETFEPVRADCSATISFPTGGSVDMEVTFDGGTTWYPFDENGQVIEPASADVSDPPDIRWRAKGSNPGEDVTWDVSAVTIVTEGSDAATSITPFISTDGGATWHEVALDTDVDVTAFADDEKTRLRLKLELSTTDSGSTPTVDELVAFWTASGFPGLGLGDVTEAQASMDKDLLYMMRANALEAVKKETGARARWRWDEEAKEYVLDYNYTLETLELDPETPIRVRHRRTDHKKDRVTVIS